MCLGIPEHSSGSASAARQGGNRSSMSANGSRMASTSIGPDSSTRKTLIEFIYPFVLPERATKFESGDQSTSTSTQGISESPIGKSQSPFEVETSKSGVPAWPLSSRVSVRRTSLVPSGERTTTTDAHFLLMHIRVTVVPEREYVPAMEAAEAIASAINTNIARTSTRHALCLTARALLSTSPLPAPPCIPFRPP